MNAKSVVVLLALLAALSAHAGDPGRDAWGLALRIEGTIDAATSALATRLAEERSRGFRAELRTESVSESLAGRHVFIRSYLEGRPVLNAGFSATFDRSGTITSFHDRLPRAEDPTVRVSADDASAITLRTAGGQPGGDPELVGWVHEDGVARLAWRVVTRIGYDEYATLVDAANGSIFLSEPMFVSVSGRIFDPNPVTALNQPSLRDNDDSADAVPDSAYSIGEVEGLSSEDALSGEYVTITDLEAPATNRAKPLAGLQFDRSQDEFEEVMAYVHIDRSQRYIRSLGFTGERAIVPYAIPVDAHGVGGDDNSYYRFSTPGRGRLVFGDGGVDDAEDADIILHEYGHAIQDSIVPAGFTGTAAGEPRALGEGFGDYWAFSSSFAANVASGADPFCVGNWDALCGEGPSTNCAYPIEASCLRRVDGAKTMDDYIRSGGNGTEHRNGEIWSSALREIFVDAVTVSGIEQGRRTADRTILESHFGMPPSPSYRTAAIRLLDADRRLNSGLLEPSICRAMISRGILDDEDCGAGLRGDVTMIQSTARGSAIPDNTPSGIDPTITISDDRPVESIFVAVDVRHPRRGDLRLTLKGPDGTFVVIQTESSDSGANIVATYGLDTEPSQPLTPFLGRSAAGTWTLNVADNRGDDEGELRSWSLLLRFSGDLPLDERGRPGTERLHVAVSGTTSGAAGTRFVSDLRLLNPGPTHETATVLYTPSGMDGLTTFRAFSLSVEPGQVVALDDVVGATFRSTGTGSIEVRGNPALLITSRIYNDRTDGTFGQFFAASPTSAGIRAGDEPLNILQLRNTASFRSNLGIAELDGGTGVVEIRLYDGSGALVSTESRDIQAFGHSQIPLFGGIGGLQIDIARAEVRVADGDARVAAYGSTVDNLSGDAVFVPGRRMLSADASTVIPAVIHAEGAAGTRWRSDLWIFNGGDQDATVDLDFHTADGQRVVARAVTLAPGETRVLEDVVADTFDLEGTGSILASTEGPSAIALSSRAWNDVATGSFGQYIEGSGADDSAAPGGVLLLSHLDSDAIFRTNIGLTEVGGAAAAVRVAVLDASGTEVFSTGVELEPHQHRQLSLAQLGAPTLQNGQARVEVVSGGRIFAYASVVDNRTGDAIYVPAR
jgi:subtilisin-like proprotein convertase family protein